MPSLTPQRIRLTLLQKVKIIEESKKPNFDRKKISTEFGISHATISQILKKQKELLSSHDCGTPSKQKSSRKAVHCEVEKLLYEWFKRKTGQGIPICGSMLKTKAAQLKFI